METGWRRENNTKTIAVNIIACWIQGEAISCALYSIVSICMFIYMDRVVREEFPDRDSLYT